MPVQNISSSARIVPVLHGHLPYVRHPEKRLPLQELWLSQNLLECYLPLLQMLDTRIKHRKSCAITLSLSPPLIAMLSDPYYGRCFDDYTGTLLQLCESPSLKNRSGFSDAARTLAQEVTGSRDYFRSLNGDIIGKYAELAASGAISLITTAATHALLPAFRFEPSLVALQIDRGIEVFNRAFGYRTEGFWLPEMGYYAGLDRLLSESGVRYSFLDAHAAYGTGPYPEESVFRPARTESGLTVFFRDRVLSDAIWAKHGGYPGDPWYREFHADAAYILTDDELLQSGAERVPIGIKLYRITGGNGAKELYDPLTASLRAEAHAADFLEKIISRAKTVKEITGVPPVFTLPFDMELFGHWWHEGIQFLDVLFDLADQSGDIVPALPGTIAEEECLSLVIPAESSWGRGGYFSTWLNPESLGYYEEICRLFRRIQLLGIGSVCGREALRELMLAQASDWSFFMTWDTFREYGRKRLEDHLNAADRIIRSCGSDGSDQSFMEKRRRRYPLFTSFPRPSSS